MTSDPFPIRVSFATPANWQGNIGGPYGTYARPPVGGDVWLQLFDKVYADPCHHDRGLVSPAVGPSGDDLVDALTSRPGLNASTPTATTLGGLPATMLTLAGPASLSSCTDGVFRVWELPLGATNDLLPGETQRVWILAVDGKRLVVSGHELPDDTAAGRADVQRVIDSMLIEPAG